MSRARHKSKDPVGKMMAEPAPTVAYAGGNSNVVKEAKARKKGGRVEKTVKGKKAKMRLDRPGRKAGGRCGSDKAPLSSAANTTTAPGRKEFPVS